MGELERYEASHLYRNARCFRPDHLVVRGASRQRGTEALRHGPVPSQSALHMSVFVGLVDSKRGPRKYQRHCTMAYVPVLTSYLCQRRRRIPALFLPPPLYIAAVILQRLAHNMPIALPTGLGKTFIAATIRLNWFLWTRDAQIVFVAPTKPLVSQQVKACPPHHQNVQISDNHVDRRDFTWTTSREVTEQARIIHRPFEPS